MATPRARRLIAPLATLTGKVQRAGLGLLGTIIAVALLAPWLAPYPPDALICTPFERPDAAHWLGCNDVGQDLLSRLVFGAQVSLTVGIAVAVLASAVAVLAALTAGYRGGLVDRVLMRAVDVVMALPFLPLVIVLGVFFGASVVTQIIVIALVMWAQPVRELRSQVLSLRSAEFVEAAAVMGAGAMAIGRRHLLPEVLPLVVPKFVLIAHNAILIESSLSFLGLGDPGRVSWGSMLFYANARTAFLTGAWVNWILPPGLLIALTVVSFALVGFGLGAEEVRARPRQVSRVSAAWRRQPAGSLSIQGLTVEYHEPARPIRAVDDIDLDLARGEIVGLVGESGSGKTTAALAGLRLLRPPGTITAGVVMVEGKDLLGLPATTLQRLRGKRLALVPQSAMNALNPVMTVRAQVVEAITLHAGVGERAAGDRRASAMLRLVQLPDARHDAYPHELSGGMRQRAVLAIALVNEPDIVVADEPTTGLDVLTQAEIVRLLVGLQERRRMSMIFVTHNLMLVAAFADRLAVMYRGRIVDNGTAQDLIRAARHAHTRDLFASALPLGGPKTWRRPPQPAQTPVVELRGVDKRFEGRRWLGRRHSDAVTAVRDLSLAVHPGEVVGLVGGSGSGKTTTARLITGRYRPDRGEIRLDGRHADQVAPRARRQTVQMVFQDPYQSLRPAMRVFDVVAEPLRNPGMRPRRRRLEDEVRDALAAVQLPTERSFLSRPAGSLSGGQRQRLAFARAILPQPRLIIADEPTSMLDHTLRRGMLALMETLRAERNTSFLFITHDMALARHFCDRLLVMQNGRLVEQGPADEVALQPRHPYTQALVAAVERSIDPGVGPAIAGRAASLEVEHL